jgi:hypothetical protein
MLKNDQAGLVQGLFRHGVDLAEVILRACGTPGYSFALPLGGVADSLPSRSFRISSYAPW